MATAAVMEEGLYGNVVKAGEASIGLSLRREHGFEPLRVEGEIPVELEGTLYRNGPGLLGQFGRHYSHIFEGDGAISAVRLGGGVAQGAVRLVQSEGLREEREKKKMLYGYGVPWPARFWRQTIQKKQKNTANTSVMQWQGRLFALMEAAKPTELSLEDLETLGERDFDGMILQSFSAHPHAVPGRNALYNFGMVYGKDTFIELFEFPLKGEPRKLGAVPLRAPVMLHDFMVTERHFVFFVSPAKVRVLRAVLGLGPFQKLFEWKPEEGTEIIVVPIDQPEQITRFHVDPFYQWHFANGFERDEEIIIDLVRYRDFSSFYDIDDPTFRDSRRDLEGWGKYHRAFVNPGKKQARLEQLSETTCEFPKIHPDLEGKDYRYVWVVTSSEGDAAEGIMRFDMETQEEVPFAFEQGQAPSEAIFVPRKDAKDESDGHVLTLVYDRTSHASFLAIFEADKISEGPVAKAWFDHHIPTTFHGTWVPSNQTL